MTTLSEILKQFRNSTGLYLNEEKKLLIESFLTQTYTSMVQAEVERLEKQLKVNLGLTLIEMGYQMALEDQINYWKNKLK